MDLLRDVRFALRLMARNKTFAVAALTIVALGVGATTAVFSVVRAVLLQPLPYRAPDRLVLFRAEGPGVVRQAMVTGDELAAIDPLTFAAVAALLAAIALVASALPAIRASRVDPMLALRSE